MASCSCCGEQSEHLAALLCHQDVVVCEVCVGWLRTQFPTAVEATPILRVADLDEAGRFWAAVGQDLERWAGGGYGFVGDDGQVLHLSEDEPAGGGECYLYVADVEAWHRGWSEAGHDPGVIEEKPWGLDEFTVHDPAGNVIRVGQPVGD
jgi:hypothetical protein